MTLSCVKKYTFLLPLFLMVQGIYFLYNFSPLHESVFYYHVFNVVYSNYFANGEILQWLPFSSYGINAETYLLGALTIFKYFFIIIGSLLRITDAMLLFKLALLFEELVFLLGVYVLSRDLFKRGETVLFVCICSVGSIVLTNQAGFNFYSYYLLPFVIYFLRRFFVERTLLFLPLSVFIVLLSVPGQGVYFLIIFFVELVTIFSAFSLHHHREWRDFLKLSGKDAALSGLFTACSLTLLFSFLYISFIALKHLKTLSVGRDLASRETPLDIFLNYGGQIGFGKFIDFVSPAAIRAIGHLDMTLYIGLISLSLAIYAIIKVRDPLFKGLIAVVIVMGLFSLGGYVSTIMYYVVPGMKYYRHIGLSIGSFKLFLPLMAGFGLDYLLNNASWYEKRSLVLRIMVALLLVVSACSCYFAAQASAQMRTTATAYLIVAVVAGVIVIVTKNFPVCLLIALCVEMSGYQVLVHTKTRDWLPVELPARANITEKVVYSPIRTFYTSNERGLELMPYTSLLKGFPAAPYNFYNNFLQWDSCTSGMRTDLVNKHLADMIETRGGITQSLRVDLPVTDNILMNAIGCRSPKLRLASNIAFAGTEQEGIKMLKANNDDESLVILNGVSEQIRRSWVNYGISTGRVNVTGFTYNSLEAEAFVPESFGAWLYYADAYHPSWQAAINSKQVAVYQANTGFKAIFLPPGKSLVRFSFENAPAIRWSLYCVVLFGLGFTLACLIWGIRLTYQTVSSRCRE